MDRREELEGWIAGSRATQKKLRTIVLAAAALSFALLFVSRAIGGICLASTAFIFVAGYWITAGHIADWEERIYRLDHPETTRPRSGRRYQSD